MWFGVSEVFFANDEANSIILNLDTDYVRSSTAENRAY